MAANVHSWHAWLAISCSHPGTCGGAPEPSTRPARFRDQSLLEQGVRGRIYAYVQRHPGAGMQEIIDATGATYNTVRYHTDRLCKGGLLSRRTDGNAYRFVVPGDEGGSDWRKKAALRDAGLHRLHRDLQGRRTRSVSQVLQDAQADWGWSPSTTYYRLQKLERLGLARLENEGSRRMVRCTGPADLSR